VTGVGRDVAIGTRRASTARRVGMAADRRFLARQSEPWLKLSDTTRNERDDVVGASHARSVD
jgi:hypothetical protein